MVTFALIGWFIELFRTYIDKGFSYSRFGAIRKVNPTGRKIVRKFVDHKLFHQPEEHNQ